MDMNDTNNNSQTGQQDLQKIANEGASTAQPAASVAQPPVQEMPDIVPEQITPEQPVSPVQPEIPTASPNVPVESSKKGSPVMAVAVVLLIVAIIVAVGYVAYTKFVVPRMVPAATATPVQAVTPTEVPVPEMTPQASDSGVPSTDSELPSSGSGSLPSDNSTPIPAGL
jgi:hypothetical protein